MKLKFNEWNRWRTDASSSRAQYGQFDGHQPADVVDIRQPSRWFQHHRRGLDFGNFLSSGQPLDFHIFNETLSVYSKTKSSLVLIERITQTAGRRQHRWAENQKKKKEIVSSVSHSNVCRIFVFAAISAENFSDWLAPPPPALRSDWRSRPLHSLHQRRRSFLFCFTQKKKVFWLAHSFGFSTFSVEFCFIAKLLVSL